ncbi:YdeI/OmpD-associated family protein [Blastococcus brunescens]|uniref:YdeI/OmpD-associated family protein n=1 Tax=Blastococcus brunescens TaxID=1564165 RepID=A0ABZ1AZ94_9ACTN|nr:YdeI/OmpD-associated family protein [Blastococcus sp. BMG 8361]WRL63892.1 YdeI/OmpD-associated family protein [Blastococcus sp. BMG 8361]
MELGGKTATGLEVPTEVVDALGAGKKPPVVVTLSGHSYRSTVAVMGGRYLLPLSAENRAAAGVAAGEDVEVGVELDTEPREVTVPEDLAAALAREEAAREAFEQLSYSNRRRHVMAIEDAKTPETRQRRITRAVETLREGRR